MIIPSINIKKRRIIEEDLLAEYESGPLWVLDLDAKIGKELNFKVYDDLAGQYEIYVDGEFKHEDDVSDGITMGANFVTISERTDESVIRNMLSVTESLILYHRADVSKVELFKNQGGAYIYSDSHLDESLKGIFTRKLGCDNCILLMGIGEYNGRGNKETDILSKKNTG